MNPYGRRLTVALRFDAALRELTTALEENGVEIMCRADCRRFLGRFAHHAFRRYLLLAVAVPSVALETLREDLSAGAVLPTTLAIFEVADGATAVVVGEPFAALGSDQRWRRLTPRLAAAADFTCSRLARALMDFEQAARACTELRALVG